MANQIRLYYTKDYPRPADGNLTGAAPGGGDITGDDVVLAPLRMQPFLVETNEDSGRMHGGILYSNILDARYSHSIYLQPKILTQTVRDFLNEFWMADFKYIQFPNESPGKNDVRQVNTSGGKIPLSRINDNKYLNEITLELTEVLPNGN
jgi:hypothetical protein